MKNLLKLLVVFFMLLSVSCKEYLFVITEKEPMQTDTTLCIYYFYPANTNSAILLGTDTIMRNITYTFQDNCSKYQSGEIINFNSKQKIYKTLTP
jgi:hypothetical protein